MHIFSTFQKEQQSFKGNLHKAWFDVLNILDVINYIKTI